MDERIAAVKTLSESLGNFAPLAALQAIVSAFHTQLKDARDGQQGREQLSGQKSTDLENARKDIALMQYRNLGMLLDKFGDQPEQVLNYYELQLLQSGSGGSSAESEEFNGTVGPLATVNITTDVDADAPVILTNTGSVPLRFCAAQDDATACATGIDVAAGGVVEAVGSDFNNATGNFFNVTNSDPAQQGSYNVEVVQAA